MTPRLVAAGALIGILARVKIEPGYGSAAERDATLDALLVPRRKIAKAREAATRETTS